ncbi:MAG: Tad domain-containing protein [Anaerolineales bacterium]|nr:Tad domain-containing protein [Anaerolineales bacterium]
MIHRKTERGQALILIALAAIGLFAFAALAIDGSRSFSDKRHAQNTADTSVLTAALASIRCEPCTAQQKRDAAVAAAQLRATSNGYTHDGLPIASGPNTKVYVNLCSEEGSTDPATGWKVAPCEGIDTAHKDEYIRVRIVSTIPSTFGRVIGRQTLSSAVEAIARVQGSSSSSSGNPSIGAAMVGTKGGDFKNCLLLNGGADLYTHDSGIFINCSSDDAIFMNSNITFDMDAMGQVIGCFNDKNIHTSPLPYDPIQCDVNGGNSIPESFYIAKYANTPTMPSRPTCSTAGYVSGNTIHPGSFSSLAISGDYTMLPGKYCFSGDFNVNSSGSDISGPSGTVTIVMQGGSSFNPGNGQKFIFNDLEVFTENGNLNVKDYLEAKRFRFYSSGSGDFIVNSGATAKSNDAYIYLHRGYPKWNGDSIVNLTAPKTEDTWGDVRGLLVHMPWENTEPVDLNGGSTVDIHGTFLMPHSKVTFNGGVDFELHSQVIAYEFIVNGGGTVDIYYLASENYDPPAPASPSIQLTK